MNECLKSSCKSLKISPATSLFAQKPRENTKFRFFHRTFSLNRFIYFIPSMGQFGTDLFIHDGSNDKSLGPVSQGTGSPIFHTRGATGNWTPVGILENSYRSLHARSLRVACSHIGCTLQAPNLVGNNPSTFPGWFLRMFRVTPFMLTTRAWESTLVAGTFHFILICLYHYLFAEFFPWW